MTRIEIELPDSVHAKARALAKRDDVSLEDLIARTLTEKLQTLEQLEYLRERAMRSNRARFRRILARVPNVPPVPGDELPPGFKLPKPARKKRRRAGGE